MKTPNKLYKFSPFGGVRGGLITLCILLTLTATSCKKDKNVPKEDDPNTVTDIDGNKYKTVKIGEQIWMAENLKTSTYNDGTPISEVTENVDWAALTTGAWCHYDNDPANGAIYGKLYNWYAVGTGKLCPTGWHIPTNEEWLVLNDHLGGLEIAGGKMKATGTELWNTPNTGATNESDFTGLPGGNRSDLGNFSGVGRHGVWQTSTEQDGTRGRYLYVEFNNANLKTGNFLKKSGYSCRCVKD